MTQRQSIGNVEVTGGAIGVQNNFNYLPHATEGATRQKKLLKSIWWPKKKPLIVSLHERRIGDKLLVEELHERLVKDKNRIVVIIESVNAAKLTGMGGIGKTLTATWYAHKYEHIYEHVVWIDCGEGSLLASFQKLARDLDIKNRNELVDEEEFSTKSYEELMQFKCLWIFDNAENYKGEGGIIRVLPKYMTNFSCLITSRSREWGIEKSGYGKISDLQLNIFSAQESMDFFEDNFRREIRYTEFQLKQLCRLLGNLPLALQLAVAALNNGKIDLENYIEKTSEEDIENIVGAEFDDYEKTINAIVKITIDLLENETNGIVAKDILNIFGYIRPDDVNIDLFEEILKLNIENVSKGIDLLVKYSLISKESKIIHWDTHKSVASIHRLLQQVVRHNGRTTKEATLRKIFVCEGFVDYKLIPFIKYADEQLKNEFPKVKAELVDQQQLKNLVGEKRFDESVGLARLIDKELQRNVTKLNYAICLEMNEQLEDNIIVLEELYKREMKEVMVNPKFVEMGMLKLKEEVTKSLVGGHLLVSHWKMKNKERVREILEERKSFQMISSHELTTTLLAILKSNLLESNYVLANDQYRSMFKLAFDGDTKKVHLVNYSADLSFPLPNDLQELFLSGVVFKDGNGKDTNKIDVSDWLPKELNTLKMFYRQPKEIILSLGSIVSIEIISLSNFSLSLDSAYQISPKELRLENISFIKNGKQLSNVNVNEFTDFHKINQLELIGHKKNLTVDLSEESVNMEYLYLNKVTVLSLKSASGNGRVNIKEARIVSCSLDLSILPPSLEKLSLIDTNVLVSGGIDLSNLKFLKLDDISHLSHFRSLQLTYLYLYRVGEVNTDILPRNINIIRIDRNDKGTRLLGGVIHLEKLILENFSLNEVEEILSHFNLKQLVLQNYNFSYKPRDLIQLMGKEILIIAIGVVDWWKQIILNQVDRKSQYYVLEGGRGKAITQQNFYEMYVSESFIGDIYCFTSVTPPYE